MLSKSFIFFKYKSNIVNNDTLNFFIGSKFIFAQKFNSYFNIFWEFSAFIQIYEKDNTKIIPISIYFRLGVIFVIIFEFNIPFLVKRPFYLLNIM